MKTIIKLIPFILCLNLSYGQTTYSEESSDATDSSDTNSILQNIETYLENLGAYLGYDVTAKPPSTPTDSLFDSGSTQKQLENLTVKMYFGFINYSWNYPYFLPESSNAYASVFNSLCGMVFKDQSFTPAATSLAIDLQYKTSNSSTNGGSGSSSDNGIYRQNPVSQYLHNMLFITPNDACITSDNKWNSNFAYCEGLVYANALGLGLTNDSMKTSSSSSGGSEPINTLSTQITTYKLNYPTTNPSDSSNTYLIQQLDSTGFIGPLMYDTEAKGPNPNSSLPSGLPTSNQLEAAQNYVRYITGGIKPKSFSSYSDLNNAISGVNSATDVQIQMNYFKPFAKYLLDFRIYAARVSLAVQNIYDSLAYRMNLNGGASTNATENNPQSSQALNEYVMASYRLYNPSAPTDSNTSTSTDPNASASLKTTAWQDMINTASPPTVQKEMALLLAEINYQLYQMRQQQEKIILTNSVFLLNNLTEPSLTIPTPADASSSDQPG